MENETEESVGITDSDVEQFIEEESVRRIKKYMTDRNQERGKHYHVSSFVYECMRKVWYEQTLGDMNAPDDEGYIRMWIGTKLHETEFSDTHEYPLRINYDGSDFGGTIDELMEYNGMKIIVDKKFVGRIPRTMNDHYLNQIMMYAALMKMDKGIYVDGVALLYYLPHMRYGDGERKKAFFKRLTHEEIDKQQIKLESMIKEVNTHIRDNTVPDRNVSWYCKYCPYKAPCDIDSGVVNQ